MRIIPFFLLITAITFNSCSSTKKTATRQVDNSTAATTTESSQNGRDGLSYETAIIIKEKTEKTGVDAEYIWIKKHYSNYQVKGQSLNYKDKKPFDIVTIILSDGKNVPIYFDISNYFGKF